jgi:hypothetical protein
VISTRTLTALAYLAHADIERHRRDKQRVPLWLIEAHYALSHELAGRGHQSSGAPPESAIFETVAERARRTGRSERTVRRYAAQTGGHFINGAWFWIIERTPC